MSTSVTWGSTGLVHLPFTFPLQRGGRLLAGRLAFEQIGSDAAPPVLVLGGISADRHLCAHAEDPRRGWWEGCVGAGCAIDPRHWRLLGIDWLGGSGASSGPCTEPGEPFPTVTTADQADAIAHLLDELGIGVLHAIVGASFGASVALAFAARHPGRVARVVVISGADRSHPLAVARRALQRRIVALGRAAGDEQAGVTLARALAMTSYRSADEFAARFHADPLAAADYVLARGAASAAAFDAQALDALTLALDLHDVDVAPIRAAVALVGIRQDLLVPIGDLRALAGRLGARAKLHELDSIHGHDAFLKERAALTPILRAALGGRS